ncbi:pimeloyl-ACP methyl ester carboxylesterase [Pseudonocardia hierapolitana]|uniref:Pimeloyl-ACP methyl ester carboxylesterase n=1 Tax=Pseudonocardia hierapolitana TaxID=1128676 RepID=A0A561STN4_9PSEU|nr:alpha/beta hydrolase [Pseudonocardia hierapolitana]TWF78201.1 pimeloyl-ACP methyl ester carboxylesterase [Pseudonocardia hierapolitana]
MELRVRSGGRGEPVVLLLHGLGATAEVWDGLLPLLPGAWVAPDLPGHGGSAPLPAYTFAGVAEAVADMVDPAGTVVLGHSFGGVVGLHLAARPGVRAVIGLGIKVAWTPEELARAAALAAREPARFATRDEAVARHLRVSGLDGLVAPDSAAALAGVVERDGMWRPALDPRAFGVGDPQLAALLAAAPVPVVLARGEHDTMVSAEQLRALVPSPVDLPGLGHNAHVEAPAAVAELLLRHRDAAHAPPVR